MDSILLFSLCGARHAEVTMYSSDINGKKHFDLSYINFFLCTGQISLKGSHLPFLGFCCHCGLLRLKFHNTHLRDILYPAVASTHTNSLPTLSHLEVWGQDFPPKLLTCCFGGFQLVAQFFVFSKRKSIGGICTINSSRVVEDSSNSDEWPKWCITFYQQLFDELTFSAKRRK